MKGFMKRVDMFCYRHPRFGVNNLMLYIVIGNAIVWLLGMMDTTGLANYYLAGYMGRVLRGEIWRLVTFVFIPSASTPLSLLLFLYFYYFIGSTLEREWGAGRFTIYYLMGMLLTALYGLIASILGGRDIPVNAGYLNLSMFFAFATLYPEHQVLLFFIIPIKMKWLAVVDAAYFVIGIVQGLTSGMGLMSLLPLVALLNYFIFCGDALVNQVVPGNIRQKKKTVDFKREVRRMQYESKTKPYTRKCEVCGRTDADFPELEFRYCSRCEGYHCFCQDHISNHTHFRQ